MHHSASARLINCHWLGDNREVKFPHKETLKSSPGTAITWASVKRQKLEWDSALEQLMKRSRCEERA
jgi:hypothetical protein